MDSVRTFFAGQNRHTAFPNNQQNGYGGNPTPLGNGLTNGATGNSGGKLTNPYDMKRKDSDNYFYIMWRS